MRGKFSQIRIVEKQELFKSAWVEKDNELKVEDERQGEEGVEWDYIKVLIVFSLLSFIKEPVKSCEKGRKAWFEGQILSFILPVM